MRRQFAISDIHGCSKTFQKLIDTINLKKEDQLFLLGDYINKGPDSKGVLDIIMNLKNHGFDIICLNGNHDQMLLDFFEGKNQESWFKEEEKIITLKSFNVNSPENIPKTYIGFIKHLPLYYESNEYILVHAGFDFSKKDIYSDIEAMMNIKSFKADLAKTNNRKIIHGHVPKTLDNIEESISNNANQIPIDGGCVYYRNENLGNLIAYNIDKKVLIVQPNIDKPYKIKIKDGFK